MTPKKIVSASENFWFLFFEIIFCTAFLASCEVPNWLNGPRSPNECVDRWMFSAGLVFVPSGIQNSNLTGPRTNRNKRE